MPHAPDAPAAGPSGTPAFRRRRLIAVILLLLVLSVTAALWVAVSMGSPGPTGPDSRSSSSTEPSRAPGTIPEDFPSAETTGLPQGTTLSDYTGQCRITTPNTVIDQKQVDCWPLQIDAPGVVITRSQINGFVYSADDGAGSFSISDSEVNSGDNPVTGIGDVSFTATRVHVTGGKRSVMCYRECTVEGSYVHGQFTDATGYYHESGIRMGSNAVIRGNTIACDAPDVPPDGGCSGALTGYGDFAVIQNNVIDGNVFIAGSGGYCTYGGSTTGKPHSVGTRDIRFTNNIWQRGTTSKCGDFGPITSFDSDAPGNVWSNNRWEDGTPVAPAN
ncbi:hypothetical protein [Cryobacterium sp. PAMC25264]|uniref:hypothetical protein n=1 Tax=Cryobacterium sp. PAMC25264 TaxID=2861288 RepID=UPI001C6388D5|nr:hypothetical protein [Cryobacterium sp. PAMC25264]QYF72842.1 hypothetical protein KY500_13805 [Cryobacterium sp. PAMC25264]